ncbi:MAG: DUF2163 domain-containing protein [Candidatus Accumulibacter sp.]|uniref:DUF2163 domain-containing protein n=1 Tax=Accumulibacter sp. TaxID=2053492 RepID=UPI0025883B47|nr:DUF2163 domain-containing protein [Accumulibacter sp.]MBK8113515.1 DUF2163 domain-containing protein [Accumulibacter sp.]
MKSVVADHRYRVLCLRIVPTAGSPIYLTDHPRALVMGGHTYLSTAGYEFTGYAATSGFSPASIDIEGIAGASGVTRAAVGSGLFDGARCYVFATSWASPVEDEEPITAGIFGKSTLLDDRFQIGGVSLVDALNQSVGQTYGAQCPKAFCGQEYGGCMASLAANTVTGTLTSVSSASVFTDSARAEADDTFGAGTIQFTSGPNAGLKPLEIKSFAAGVITTFEPFYYLPVVGNSYSMVRGCRKRLSDCQARWNGASTYSNVENFGGFPYIPTGSTYATVGQQ